MLQCVNGHSSSHVSHDWCCDFLLWGQRFSDFIFSLQASCLLFAISTPVMLSTVHLSSYSHPVKPNSVWQHLCNAFSHPHWFVLLSLFLSFSVRVDLFLVFTWLKYNLKKSASACIYLCFLCLFESVRDYICVCLCTRVAVQKSYQLNKKRKLHKHLPAYCESHCLRKLFFFSCCQSCGFEGKHSRNTERRHFNWIQCEILNLHRNICNQVYIHGMQACFSSKYMWHTHRHIGVTSVKLTNPHVFSTLYSKLLLQHLVLSCWTLWL